MAIVNAERTEVASDAPVCVLGHHDLDYPRNRAIQAALRAAGRMPVVCHSRAPFPLRHLILAAKLIAAPRAARVVFVTEGGHRLVPWVRALAMCTGRRVMFDPFLSRYNTRVEDRRWHAPGSLQAQIAHFQDWSSTRAADFLIFDTEEHRAYFFERYQLDKPSAVLPVGLPEDLFAPRPDRGAPDGPIEVLFYGTFIPLQGATTIVEAAHQLAGRLHVRITLVGEGQTHPAARARARELGLAAPGLAFAGRVPFEGVPERLARSHIALGIFGTTDKAARVVPNKVVQAAAMARPIITADTPAIRRFFVDRQSVYLVPAGDPTALAAAILQLAQDKDLRARLAAGARQVFETSFSQAAAARVLTRALGTLEG